MNRTAKGAWFGLMLLLPALCLGQTVVLDFEDLPGVYNLIPAGYGGIADWGGWTTCDLPSDDYQPHSGVVWAYSLGGGDLLIEFGTNYIFEGSYISGPEGAPEWVVWYELFHEGVLVHTSVGVPPVPTSTWQPSGYDGLVDAMKIKNTIGNFFCMDDFTYSIPTTASEESSLSKIKALY